MNEEGHTLNLPLEKVSMRYFKRGFLFDVFALIPFGALEYFIESLCVLWVLKAIRIFEVRQYLKNRFYRQIADDLVMKMQNRMLHDLQKRNDKFQDFGQSKFKIIFRGIFKFLSVLMQVLLFVQFISNFWLLFVRIQNIYIN